jgi:hypothetical protein
MSSQGLAGMLAAVALGVGAGLVTTPVHTHHAFSAEFDANRPVHFEGTIARVEWINPHTWIHIDVPQDDGSVERWMIEGGNPHNLLRRGITRNVIGVGMPIVVDGYASKDGTRRANGRDLRLPDGRSFFLGSSGTGAPRDGRDPGDR